eukprot:gnl/TRDRNA2_/TRDRNA2_173117_c0_seq6.p1 gnl/TRDRNA2_/TRDRNA2_173117_c0~~gnl/TRDRNA2_/TRDRNA2_173117_c0_seq6.p1  ORF type:complete len:282 (+),score=42.03 gnl/TRDRNA2_/TRDRNA2_173117_c0_seq6:47-892(+)
MLCQPCDEGKKSFLYAYYCNGNERTCNHCGQWVCQHHACANTDGLKGGHSDCKGPQCQIDAIYKHLCEGPLQLCDGCNQFFCRAHSVAVGAGVLSGGHCCDGFQVCDEGKKNYRFGLRCSGPLQACKHCGQNLCEYHRLPSFDTLGVQNSGHSDCVAPESERASSVGAAAGSTTQNAIEEIGDTESKQVPGGNELHEKSSQEWAEDSFAGGVAGLLAGVVSPAANGARRVISYAINQSPTEGDDKDEQAVWSSGTGTTTASVTPYEDDQNDFVGFASDTRR